MRPRRSKPNLDRKEAAGGHVKPSKVLFAVLALAIALNVPLDAQPAAALAGVITSPAGSPVANATISITNTATGRSSQAQSDAAGLYSLQGLAPGAYTVSVSAHGYAPKTVSVTLNGAGTQRLDLPLTIGPAEPALGDLGFSPEQTQGNAEEQARLNKRSHML